MDEEKPLAPDAGVGIEDAIGQADDGGATPVLQEVHDRAGWG